MGAGFDRAAFDLADFYAAIGAITKERAALRQDLVRGLKDWYVDLYGYDRYGAETAFLLRERMAVPQIFGFAVLRILHDRRISERAKTRVAQMALDLTSYEEDMGIPFGLLVPVQYLGNHGGLSAADLRFALIIASGSNAPFEGLERAEALDFLRLVLGRDDLPAEERALWGHALLSRHRETAGTAELLRTLLGSDHLPIGLRRELCWSWVHARQPRIDVTIPLASNEQRARFVTEHMPFWIAHVRSWPTPAMVRAAAFWLSLLGEDPLTLARQFMAESGPHAEQLHAGAADIIAEHRGHLDDDDVKVLIEQGIQISGSAPTRRRFYALGSELFGARYLTLAAEDRAGSVRQWAARQREKRQSAPEENLALPPGKLD